MEFKKVFQRSSSTFLWPEPRSAASTVTGYLDLQQWGKSPLTEEQNGLWVSCSCKNHLGLECAVHGIPWSNNAQRTRSAFLQPAHHSGLYKAPFFRSIFVNCEASQWVRRGRGTAQSESLGSCSFCFVSSTLCGVPDICTALWHYQAATWAEFEFFHCITLGEDSESLLIIFIFVFLSYIVIQALTKH